MRILYIADGRSPIALPWISSMIEAGHEVHLLSSFPCQAVPGLASFEVIPLAFSEAAGNRPVQTGGSLRRLVPVRLRTRLRQWLGPFTLPRAAGRLKSAIQRRQPELVHAMRIPYEGMAACLAVKDEDQSQADMPPLLISIWGNDFTLHAPSTPMMSYYTGRALELADALHTDCQRDQRLARHWGYSPNKPSIVLPGGGGIPRDIFYPGTAARMAGAPPTVINPRGLRAYVRNDTFFNAVQIVLATQPGIRFICTGMAGEAEAERWVNLLDLQGKVELLPAQTRQQMADLFRQALVSVSITTHDGTPNTLLEALACGCFPIAGDLESLREWITPGVNGWLVDPYDAQGLAQAILDTIAHPELRISAREFNQKMIAERTDQAQVMGQMEAFYHSLIKS